MPEPWSALIATLTETRRRPLVTWPDSQRHLVRCLNDVDESGCGLAPLEATPSVDIDILALEALKLHGPMTVKQLAQTIRRDRKALANRMPRLRRTGHAQQVDVGVWAACECAPSTGGVGSWRVDTCFRRASPASGQCRVSSGPHQVHPPSERAQGPAPERAARINDRQVAPHPQARIGLADPIRRIAVDDSRRSPLNCRSCRRRPW